MMDKLIELGIVEYLSELLELDTDSELLKPLLESILNLLRYS